MEIDGKAVLLGFDPYYHLRRADLLDSGIGIPKTDYYSAYPWGAQSHWPPVFDVLGMFSLKIGGLFGMGKERSISYLPVFLGLLSIPAMIPFFTRSDPRYGMVAALLFSAVLPAHIRPGCYGFSDHHVLEMLLTTLTLSLLTRAERMPMALLTGFLLGFSQLSWRGAVVVTVIGAVALLSLSFIPLPRVSTRTWSARGVVIMGTALLVYLLGVPLGLVNIRSMTFYELSAFQTTPLALAGLILLFRYVWIIRKRVISITVAGLSITGIAVAARSMFPVYMDGLMFLFGKHRWRETITESHNLFSAAVYPPWGAVEELFGGLMYLFPLMFIYLIWRLKYRENSARDMILLVWSAIFAAMAFKQHRYAHQLAVPYCLLLIMTGMDFRRYIKKIRPALRVLMAVFVVFTFIPMFTFHYHLVTQGLSTWVRIPKEQARAMWWIRHNTPECGLFRQPGIKPDYGVMNTWETGHWITWLARRAPVANNFGAEPGGHDKGLDASCRFYTTPDSRHAEFILEKLGVRYVITEPPGEKLTGFAYISGYLETWQKHGYQMPVSIRLHMLNGSDALSADHRRVPGTDHLRLIYESGDAVSMPDGTTTSSVKIFERVTGAKIIVPDNIEPPYTLTCKVLSNTGATFTYSRRYNYKTETIPLIYSVVNCPYKCKAASPAVLSWTGGSRQFVASETAVLTGGYAQEIPADG